MELHLFRHGETDWNKEGRAQSHNGSQLSSLGVQQAKAVGEKIKNVKFNAIYSSSSLRTRQTAKIMWPEQENQITYSFDYREIELGPWEGKLYKDLKLSDPSAHAHFFSDPHLFHVAGAETFENLTERSVKAINSLFQRERGKTIALVSHGAFIKALLTKIEGKKLSQIWDPPFMHNCAHNILKFKSISSIKIKMYADNLHW